MLAKAFLMAVLLVAINYYEKTHGAPAPEDNNHLGDHRHIPTGKILLDSADPVGLIIFFLVKHCSFPYVF